MFKSREEYEEAKKISYFGTLFWITISPKIDLKVCHEGHVFELWDDLYNTKARLEYNCFADFWFCEDWTFCSLPEAKDFILKEKLRYLTRELI